jgi:uncharacterized sulfatase
VVALAVLVAVAALYLVGRIMLYRQFDDEQHLAFKRTYLERLAEMTGSSPAGPNLVMILFDDLGAGDIGAYGGGAVATPNLDRLASQGLLFGEAYSSSPYCSASRAGLLTGRYAVRAGLDHVAQVPGTWEDALLRLGGLNRRLPAEEITLAEVLRAAGYDTAIIGKWHLGDESPSLPNDMGFASFYGLLFSNDQGEPVVWQDRLIVEPAPIDQTTLTRRYTERAVAFIEEDRDGPFFLYLPHTFPHIPLHVAADRRGRSAAGLYGDVVEELDWSTGAVLDALTRTGATNNTLVIVTSDNGPWFQGSPGGVRGRKFDVFEGGMRVPLLAWWPGRIAPGRVDDEPVIGVDLFPTVLELATPGPPARRARGRRARPDLVPSDRSPARSARRPLQVPRPTPPAVRQPARLRSRFLPFSGTLVVRPRARSRRVVRRVVAPPGDLPAHAGGVGGTTERARRESSGLAVTLSVGSLGGQGWGRVYPTAP